MPKIKDLDALHPEHDPDEIMRFRALYEGGRAFRRFIADFLPQNPDEPGEVWEKRQNSAYYQNYTGPIVDFFGAWLFAEEPQVEADGDFIKGFMENVDKAGTDLPSFYALTFLDALIGKRGWTWVNLPARQVDADGEPVTFASAAAQLASGALDAFLVRIKPEEIRDWGTDDKGALTWVMFRQELDLREAPPSPRRKVWRWTAIDTTTITTWEWEPKQGKSSPGPEDVADEVSKIAHSMGGLPVIRTEIPKGLWVLNKLYEPAIGQFRRRTALSWSLDRAAYAMPAITREWEADGELFGTGYFIRLRPGESVEWLEPSGTAFTALATDNRDLTEELFRLVHQMALAAQSDSNRSRMSGESKEHDFDATRIILATYGKIIRDSIRDAMRLAVGVRADTDAETINVKGLEGWGQESLEAFLNAAIIAKPLVKSETFRKIVAKRTAERLLGDEVSPDELDAIRSEIDAADFMEPSPFLPPPLPGAPPSSEPDDGDDEDAE